MLAMFVPRSLARCDRMIARKYERGNRIVVAGTVVALEGVNFA
jgi:hypothetical protein